MPKEEHRGSRGKPSKARSHRIACLGAMSAQRPDDLRQKHQIPPERSAMMARIGQKNTAPELAVRGILHRLGARFRLHRRDLPGTPDIVLPGRRLALLVHGCFWHRHHGCPYCYTPKSRLEFWATKFARNLNRDRAVQRALTDLGWRFAVIWECETRDTRALERRIRRILTSFPATASS
jgi:DNA mismatch endonuclease (patch repair protein)